MKEILAHHWWYLGILVLLTGFLGALGLHEEHKGFGFLDLLYHTLRLFKMDMAPEIQAPVALKLEVARFLGPLVAASAAIAGLAELFKKQMRSLSLRFLKDHVVICGLGREGIALARNMSETRRTLVIEIDESNDHVPACLDLGSAVVVGDATDPEILQEARVTHANSIITVCGDDGVNVEITVRIYEMVKAASKRSRFWRLRKRRSPDIRCLVHVVDPKLCTSFKQHRIFQDEDDRLDVRIFNAFEKSARLLLHDHPLDGEEGIGPQDPTSPHLVIIGFGRMGESVALQAAQMGHFANKERLRISLIDREMGSRLRNFRSRYPTFNQVCDLQGIESEVEDEDLLEKLESWSGEQKSLTTIVLCFDNDTHALSVALLLNTRLKRYDVPILVRMAQGTDRGLTSVVSGSAALSAIKPFGLFDSTYTEDNLLDDRLDTLAREIHRHYVSQMKSDDQSQRPAVRKWEDLDPIYRDSNRQQADHMYVKLRAIGARVEKSEGAKPEEFRLTDAGVETLARMEHARWYVSSVLANYTYGPRDEGERQKETLVNWPQLPEADKEYNRSTVRQIPAYLKSVGWASRRDNAHVRG